MNPSFNRTRYTIFLLLTIGYFLVYFHRLSPAVVAVDLMKTFHSGGALMGLLGSAYFYPYAVMQFPAGLLSDSWGPRKTMTLFLSLGVAGALLFGLAPTFGWALFARVLVGVGVSMVFIPAMKLLAVWFRPREFVYMTAALMSTGGLGSLSAATPLAWLSRYWGWRFSFILIGAATLILVALIWWLVRDRPEEMGFEPVTAAPPPPSPAGRPPALLDGMRKVLTTFHFWPLAVWFFFTCGIFFSFIGLWGGPFLIQVYGLSRQEAANVLSLAAVGMMVGSPLLGLLSDRVLKGRKPVLILSSLLMVLTTAPLAFFTASLHYGVLLLICLNLGFFSAAIVTIAFTTTKELFPASMAGTATGTVNLFPFFGGAVFQPLIGWLLEIGGRNGPGFTAQAYQGAFKLYFLAALIALLAIPAVKETLPQ